MNKELYLRLKYFSIIFITGIIFYSCGRQVSVTPPDAPPPDGAIFISTYPEGFQIFLNGREQRRITPDTIKWLANGVYQVTLKKNLFNDFMMYVKVGDQSARLKIPVSIFYDFSKDSSMLGSIFCDSNPEKAEVFLNDSSTGQFTPVTISNILPGNYEVRYHLQNHRDDSVNIVVNSNSTQQVSMFLLDTLLWQQYTTDNSPIGTNNLTCVGIDKNDVVWVGTDDQGVVSFNGNTWGGKQVYAILPSKHVNCITVDNNNVMFFGTNNGFVTYNGSVEHMYGFKSSGLPNYTIESICFDNSDNWYIGTQGGVCKSTMNGGTWATYGDSMVSDSHINCVLCDNSDNLWVGMNSAGITEINNSITDWQNINNSTSHIINNNIRALAKSPNGEIWVGFGTDFMSGGGLSYFNGTGWNNLHYLPYGSQTNAIYIDKNNTKWVATDQGLVKITAASTVTNFNKDNTGMQINDVTGVAGDSKGNIWFSTYGGGLVEYKGNH